jgi:hypothetical protein
MNHSFLMTEWKRDNILVVSLADAMHLLTPRNITPLYVQTPIQTF